MDCQSKHLDRRASESTQQLLRRFGGEVQDLLECDLLLARAELAQSLKRVGAGLARIIVASLLLLAGSSALIVAAIALLAHWLPAWLAAGSVGSAVTILGWAAVVRARQCLGVNSLTLSRTRRSVTSDIETITRRDGRGPQVRDWR
jgi:hypothetical protein